VRTSNPTEVGGDWAAAGDDDPAQGGTGWRYTRQTYDWQGRVLVTTNQDTTTRTLSYSGCGCAGGTIITSTDEVGRRQKVYQDVFGRAWKTELLNWDGSVYATTAQTFNTRDQVPLVRQFAGLAPTDPQDLSCPTGTCQQTTMSYDGFGRLQTQHRPEQQGDPNNSAATDHTTWTYNADDTVHRITDARGAYAAYLYNSRHLTTSITYGTLPGVPTTGPSAVAPAAPVTFTYDAGGNRMAMIDGQGSTSYAYDQLSRLTTETRHVNELADLPTGGDYTFTYEYNLAGALSRVTDPFGAQVGYSRDAAGRISAVTGAGYGNTTLYASDFQYRAWGALKRLAYPDGRALDVSYNARLQARSFVLASAGPTNQATVSMTYEYNADGRLRYARDVLDGRFDRSYGYDHAGRLTQALSGAEARGEPATNDRPYRQFFSFDAWGNMTARSGKHWRKNLPFFSGTHVNNRMSGWQYDADGQVTVVLQKVYGYSIY
jgi:YD repeat-containing protein